MHLVKGNVYFSDIARGWHLMGLNYLLRGQENGMISVD